MGDRRDFLRYWFALLTRPILCRDSIVPCEKENAVFFFHSHSRRAIQTAKYFSETPACVSSRPTTPHFASTFQNFVFLLHMHLPRLSQENMVATSRGPTCHQSAVYTFVRVFRSPKGSGKRRPLCEKGIAASLRPHQLLSLGRK